MTEPNPYQSPDTSPFESPGSGDWDGTFEDASRSLAQTKPWVLFISILGFIGTAIMIVFVPVMLFVSVSNEVDGPAQVVMLLPILMMLGMTVLVYLIPSVLLWRYGRQIGRFLESRTPATFAAAIAAQKRFWQYVGILAIVVTALYALMIAVAIILPIVMSLMG
jgi:hypothetical protein